MLLYTLRLRPGVVDAGHNEGTCGCGATGKALRREPSYEGIILGAAGNKLSEATCAVRLV